MGLLNLIIEEESFTVIKKLNYDSHDRSIIAPIIVDIKELAKNFRAISFCFMLKEANKVVHVLARECRSLQVSCYWFEEAPMEASVAAEVDRRLLFSTHDYYIVVAWGLDGVLFPNLLSFIALGPWHGSFSHGSPTPPASLAGLQNYLRSCSEMISVVWLFPVERPRRSSRAFEVVKVVGWKRVYVGRRIVLSSGKFCLGAVTEKESQYGFFFGSGQVGARNGAARSYRGRSPLSRSPSLFLPLSNPCFEDVDNPMGFLLCVEFDDVFIPGISAVRVSVKL
ncbi:hypothetical protein V6N13_042585 [Hibiscus sabdariffa]